MVTFFISILAIFFLFLAIITSKIEIQIYNFDFNTQNKNFISDTLQINFIIKIFFIIPIFKLRLNIYKIEKILKKQRVKNIIDKEKQRIINIIDNENQKIQNSIGNKHQKIISNENKKISKKSNLKDFKSLKDTKKIKTSQGLKAVKNLKININKADLKIILGTDDAAVTSIIIPVISTLILLLLNNPTHKYNQNKKFKVEPLYNNQNLLKIDFSGIFQIKMIHIINTICIFKKNK